MTDVLGIYNYWIYVVLMMIGLYGVIAKPNLIKQAIALGLFQTGIFLYYISMAVIDGGTAPIWTTIEDGAQKFQGPYDNPLPHVLILTAIVVSVSVLAVALALIINIKRSYGTIEADEIEQMDHEDRLIEYRAGQAPDAADDAEATPPCLTCAGPPPRPHRHDPADLRGADDRHRQAAGSPGPGPPPSPAPSST
jgi:multicomponent Na+:H+ antiporter subunit C